MKKSALFYCLVLLPACDAFLDEKPKDQKPQEEIVDHTANLYLDTVANLYRYFGGETAGEGLQGTYRGIYDLNTFTTDEAVIPTRGGDWYDGGIWQKLFLHTWGAGEGPFKDSWDYLYKVIVLANQSLEQLQAALPDGNYEADKVAGYICEVRAIRAMYYYYLLDLFGRVPIVTDAETPMSEVAQSARSEVFDFVFSELTSCMEGLPSGRSNFLGEYYGRITAPVAYFLLAKLALNSEVYEDDDWTDGKAAEKDVALGAVSGRCEVVKWCCDQIAGYGYELEENYADNFAVHNESSRENILTIPMDKLLFSNQFQYIFRSLHYDHAAALGMNGENGASAAREALEANGWTEDNTDFADLDPRFYLNYYYGEVYDADSAQVYLAGGREPLVYRPEAVALDVTGSADEKLSGARMRKYEIDPNAMKDGKLMDNDIVLFRYADVLLMKAEAMIRSGEDGTALVNRVRSRAGAAALERADLEDILRERMVEFAWEGLRRQDLVRFGQYTRSYHGRPQLAGEESGYTTVFPIPADVLVLNPKLTQNYGY